MSPHLGAQGPLLCLDGPARPARVTVIGACRCWWWPVRPWLSPTARTVLCAPWLRPFAGPGRGRACGQRGRLIPQQPHEEANVLHGQAQHLVLAQLPVGRVRGQQLPQLGEGAVHVLLAPALPTVGEHATRHLLRLVPPSQLQLTMTRSLQPAAVEDAQSSCWPNVEAVEEGVRVVVQGQRGRGGQLQGRPQATQLGHSDPRGPGVAQADDWHPRVQPRRGRA